MTAVASWADTTRRAGHCLDGRDKPACPVRAGRAERRRDLLHGLRLRRAHALPVLLVGGGDLAGEGEDEVPVIIAFFVPQMLAAQHKCLCRMERQPLALAWEAGRAAGGGNGRGTEKGRWPVACWRIGLASQPAPVSPIRAAAQGSLVKSRRGPGTSWLTAAPKHFAFRASRWRWRRRSGSASGSEGERAEAAAQLPGGPH